MHKPILLVEDNPKDVELLMVALGRVQINNEIIVVRDGSEALDYLRYHGAYSHREQGDPAFVLLDLKIPKINGLQVLEQIKNDPALRIIPVVMMTSSREEADLLQSYRKGVNAYVVKPLNFRDYSTAVQDLTGFWAKLNESPDANPVADN